ncbi:MAG: hypothetical protein ACSNEK_09450 [Parachlamydiaceae bacterium]
MSFILFVLLNVLLPAYNEGAPVSLEPRRAFCFRAYDGGQQMNGQRVFKFYSTCPQDMYVSVCVKDDRGEVKLYTGPSSIKTNGTFTVYTFPNSFPTAVQWAAVPFNPALPSLCAKDKNKLRMIL